AERRPRADADADFRKDLGVEQRRRYQPARRLYEPSAHQARKLLGPSDFQDGPRDRLPVAMNSIGARLTLWYAACATGTLVVLFAIGYLLLENRLTHGLDQLNLAELKQVEARMGSDYQNYSPREISDKISQTSEYASTLFYIVVDHPHKGISFYSRNLRGNDIPDVKGKSAYNTVIPHIGPVRVDEFVMKPF